MLTRTSCFHDAREVNEGNEDQTIDSIGVRLLSVMFWGHRWWILASTLVFGCLGTILAFTMTPIYRTSVVMMSASPERSNAGIVGSALGQLGGLASLAGINVGADSGTEEALAVLKSREFTEAFVTEKSLLPRLFPNKWDSSRHLWVSDDNRPTLGEAYRYFDRKIRQVSLDQKTGLVTLQIEWSNRQEAADWANALIDRLNAEMRGRAIAKSGASIGFLQKELTSTSDLGTREAINRLIELQINHRMIASVTPEYAFQVIDRAMVPDAKDPVRPIKSLMVALGLLLGSSIGSGIVYIAVTLRKLRRA